MKHYIIITCPRCNQDDLVKNGHSKTGAQRYCCNSCKKNFQAEYAYKPGVKEQIERQTLNSSGVRDISRNLKISKNTVISELKKTPVEVNPHFLLHQNTPVEMEVEIRTDAEADEFWSYVGSKKKSALDMVCYWVVGQKSG